MVDALEDVHVVFLKLDVEFFVDAHHQIEGVDGVEAQTAVTIAEEVLIVTDLTRVRC